MSAEKGSSKADTLVKVVLVFFISLLSFSVGTFVGKQVSDSDHRRMALEGEYKADRQVASTEGKGEAAEPTDKISEKEVASLTEEFVNKEKAAGPEEVASEDGDDETADTAEAAPSEKMEKVEASGYKTFSREKTGKVADEKANKVAEKIAKGEAPTDGKSEERKPASTLPSVASSAVGKYTVQVGSYPDEKMAQNHAAELKGKGYSAFYFAANVAGHTWYRVSVGLFASQKTANEYRAQFMKDANTKSALVQKIIQ